MIFTRLEPVDYDVTTIYLAVEPRHWGDGIPEDLPGRKGDMWTATIDLATGIIRDWPLGRTEDLCMKVCDAGSYYLCDGNGKEIASIENDYVPNGIIPGSYGDYIEIVIDGAGRIEDWPSHLDFSEFSKNEED